MTARRYALLGSAALAVVVAIVAVVVATRGDSASPVETIEDVYERLDATLRMDASSAYRFEVMGTGASGETSAATIWASQVDETARREFGPTDLDLTRYVTIADGSGAYTLAANASINIDERQCPGASAAAALLLDCPNRPFETYVFDEGGSPRATTEAPEITIGETTFEGASALEVVAYREVQPFRAGPFTERHTLYLDPETMLPFLREVVQEPGGTLTFRYDVERVPASDLAADFFDPMSLPALRPDPEEPLRERAPEAPSYWLGASIEATGDVPDLELWHSSTYRPDETDPATEQLMLEYVRPGTYGQPLVLRLTEYTAEAWDAGASGSHLPSDPCWTSEEVALQGGSAMIYSGFHWPDSIPPGSAAECPTDRARDSFFAVANLGGMRVVVEPWDWPEQSREGVIALAEALQPWSE